jgi:hypothetical protein
MSREFDHSIWKLLAWIIAGLGAILLLGGIVLCVFGQSAETKISLFGQELTTTSVGVALAFLGAVTIGINFKRLMQSIDTAAKSGNDTVSTRKEAEKAVLDRIIDLFSTKRAFHQGDGKFLHEAITYSAEVGHMCEMLGYLDTGRAVIVSHSFAEVVGKLQEALAELSPALPGSIKDQIAVLVTDCKDYIDKYGPADLHSGGLTPLGHIGWNEEHPENSPAIKRYGVKSDKSIPVYADFLAYLSGSCRDLRAIRKIVVEIVGDIAAAEPSLSPRCDHVRQLIEKGNEELDHSAALLDRTEKIILDIVAAEDDFGQQRHLLHEAAKKEETPVSELLEGLSKVHQEQAWKTD